MTCYNNYQHVSIYWIDNSINFAYTILWYIQVSQLYSAKERDLNCTMLFIIPSYKKVILAYWNFDVLRNQSPMNMELLYIFSCHVNIKNWQVVINNKKIFLNFWCCLILTFLCYVILNFKKYLLAWSIKD